jgi:toxin-antitoxin system PIN domain toxin
MTPDVNVLIAAYREEHPQHGTARAWLEARLAACQTGQRLTLLPMVAASFIRLVTNRKIFAVPAPPEAAVSFIDAIMRVPGVEMAELGREWTTLRRLIVEHDLKGNDIPDAWIAAAVQTQGSHLMTFDRGFKRWLRRNELTILQG